MIVMVPMPRNASGPWGRGGPFLFSLPTSEGI